MRYGRPPLSRERALRFSTKATGKSSISVVFYRNAKRLMVGFGKNVIAAIVGSNCIAKCALPPRSRRKTWILLPSLVPFSLFSATTPRCPRLCRHFSRHPSRLSYARRCIPVCRNRTVSTRRTTSAAPALEERFESLLRAYT